MSGIAKLSVLSINGDTSLNGYRLFNKQEIVSAKPRGTGTLLHYKNHNIAEPVIPNEYILSDDISNILSLMGDYPYNYYGVPFYNNQNDITSNTTTRVISAQSILYGYPYDASNSVLYVRRAHKIEKLMCSATLDSFLESDDGNYITTKDGDVITTKDGTKIKYI